MLLETVTRPAVPAGEMFVEAFRRPSRSCYVGKKSAFMMPRISDQAALFRCSELKDGM